MRELTEDTRLADRYRVQRRLKAGGSAEVWVARDERSESTIVLKLLGSDASARDRERFRTEWSVASRLMHAHIVRVFEFHDDDDGPYYAQQYVDGPSIAALHGQPLDQLLRPIGLLADALRYAHGKGVVHSDVTAANVLLDARGAPYLIDFGVVRDAGSRAGAGGGTPVALSPQQRAGEVARAADDIYALGVLLHELLFGRPPSGDAIAEEASGGERLPGAISRLLSAMLAADTGLRPDAEGVAKALVAAGFAPGAAHLPGIRPGETAPAAEVAVQSIRPRRAAAAEPLPVASTRRGVPAPLVAGGLAALLLAFLGVLFLLPRAVDRAGDERTVAPLADESSPAAADEDGTPSPASGQSSASDTEFNENLAPTDGSSIARLKAATDEALGDLLSRLERLRYRGIERWGGQGYLDVMDRYRAGDEAYVAKNYRAAGEHYRAATEMLDPFFDRINDVFRDTMAAAQSAFDAQDHREAIRLYDLAVAITPGNAAAEQGLERARNLEAVLGLMERGREFEKNLELEAARQAFAGALDLDPAWRPAEEGLARVQAALEQLRFEQIMTEGFDALRAGLFDSARAAFESARTMRPDSRQPVDGLLQVDQEVRLARIQALETAAARQEENEQWEAAVDSYEEALSVDGDLQFAQEGLRRASERAALHRQLQAYIEDPDSLSAPQTMQAATRLLLELSRVTPAGPRLEDQKDTLARLLKRAATPLPVTLVSDNLTEVSIFRIGRIGTFATRELQLRPGSYVALGSRAGYRDVRLEFRVAPEIEMQPIVVRCEEKI